MKLMKAFGRLVVVSLLGLIALPFYAIGFILAFVAGAFTSGATAYSKFWHYIMRKV